MFNVCKYSTGLFKIICILEYWDILKLLHLNNSAIMGFIFDFSSNEVIEYYLIHRPYETKFKDPKIFSKNKSIKSIKSFLFFDIEPDAPIDTICGYTFIPNIREWSCIYVPTKLNNYSNEYLMNDSFQYKYKNKESHFKTIETFCELYKILDYPYIISHNGNRFDFLLLIAHIYRFYHDASAIAPKMKFYDTYVPIKTKINKSNLNLFEKYSQDYKEYETLKYGQHDSLVDCKMLCLWLKSWSITQI